MMIKYILHAKHRKIDSSQNDKLQDLIGEEFNEILHKAS